MLSTGFKLWFGLCVLMVAAAIFAGYTTGGTETGPISLGWKGGVGNHVVYTLLMIGAASMAVMGRPDRSALSVMISSKLSADLLALFIKAGERVESASFISLSLFFFSSLKSAPPRTKSV